MRCDAANTSLVEDIIINSQRTSTSRGGQRATGDTGRPPGTEDKQTLPQQKVTDAQQQKQPKQHSSTTADSYSTRRHSPSVMAQLAALEAQSLSLAAEKKDLVARAAALQARCARSPDHESDDEDDEDEDSELSSLLPVARPSVGRASLPPPAIQLPLAQQRMPSAPQVARRDGPPPTGSPAQYPAATARPQAGPPPQSSSPQEEARTRAHSGSPQLSTDSPSDLPRTPPALSGRIHVSECSSPTISLRAIDSPGGSPYRSTLLAQCLEETASDASDSTASDDP